MEGFLNILFCFLQAVFRNDSVRCFLQRIIIDKYAIPYTDCGIDFSIPVQIGPDIFQIILLMRFFISIIGINSIVFIAEHKS